MSEVAFHPMDTYGASYPKATLPLLPPPSWSGWLGRKHVDAESAFVQGGVSFICGRYATASEWKFLPVRDVALLLDNAGGQPSSRTAQPLLAEVKALVTMLKGWSQRVWRRRSLPVIDTPALCKQAKLIAARPKLQTLESDLKKPRRYIQSVRGDLVQTCPEPDEVAFAIAESISTSTMQTGLVCTSLKEFSPRLVAMATLRSSCWLIPHAVHERVAQRWRANYLKWLEGIRPVPGVKPLFPDLPEGVVPYAFPLLIDAAGMDFRLLKMAGIPFWRWEDMAVTDCNIPRDYRIRVLQLPCHQELHADELDWMTHAVQIPSLKLDSWAGK